MTKSELKTGMIVVLANGKEYMVYKDVNTSYTVNEDIIVAMDGSSDWEFLSSYNEHMERNNRHKKDFDIVKVIRVSHPYAFIRLDYEKEKRKILWQRKPKKKQYTYAQLREILGEEFEVVG